MKQYLDLILSTMLVLVAGIGMFIVWWQNPQMTEMQVFQYMLSKYWAGILLAIVLQIMFWRKVGRSN